MRPSAHSVLNSYIDRIIEEGQYGNGSTQESVEVFTAMLPRILVVLLALLFAASCSRSLAKLKGRTVGEPSFSIAIKLSEQAERRLHSIGETVKASAYFDGERLGGSGEKQSTFP